MMIGTFIVVAIRWWLRLRFMGGVLMSVKYYKYGKDRETKSGVEIEGASFKTMDEIQIALIKALIKKGVITKAEIINELP